MSEMEIRVPDIGDFEDVEVIEVLVSAGAEVEQDDPLITLETDKATMDVPAPKAGVIRSVEVHTGDRVSKGALIAMLEPATPGQAPASEAAQTIQEAEPQQSARIASSSDADLVCDLLVLGAGPGGYSSAFRAADLGLDVVLVERYPTLGGVCLNVGCIPSKALLHVAAVMDEAAHFTDIGVDYQKPSVDLDKLKAHKNRVVGKLTGGLAGMSKARNVRVIQGDGEFVSDQQLKISGDDAEQTLQFEQAIIAAGSRAVHLPFLPDDPRIVDSTSALELPFIPERMLIIGGGIIGLELGTVYSTLGARLDVVELLDRVMVDADADLVKVWKKHNAGRFDNIMLGTKTVSAEAIAEGIEVSFEGENAPEEPQVYDLVLQSAGRIPNSDRIAAQAAGINIDENRFIAVDRQMRTNRPHIYAIGDIAGPPMLAHKAVHEGHVAAEVAAGEILGDETLRKSAFDARVIPSVAYTDPEIAWVGMTEERAKSEGIRVRKSQFPWAASGRAIANGRDEGVTKLLFDEQTERIIGGGIVGTHAGDLIGEVALAIEMGADAVDMGKTIHPHPTLIESVGLAAEVATGSCTDLPPA